MNVETFWEGSSVPCSGGWPAPLRRGKLPFKRLFEAVEHPDTLLVPVAIGCVGGRIDIPFELGHEQMVNRLAPAAIDALNFIADVPVVIFLRQLCRGTVR